MRKCEGARVRTLAPFHSRATACSVSLRYSQGHANMATEMSGPCGTGPRGLLISSKNYRTFNFTAFFTSGSSFTWSVQKYVPAESIVGSHSYT